MYMAKNAVSYLMGHYNRATGEDNESSHQLYIASVISGSSSMYGTDDRLYMLIECT